MASNPQLLLLAGDFSYADDWQGPEEAIKGGDYGTFTCEQSVVCFGHRWRRRQQHNTCALLFAMPWWEACRSSSGMSDAPCRLRLSCLGRRQG